MLAPAPAAILDRLPAMSRAAPAVSGAPVNVIADDLIWSSRLRAAVERAGGRPSVAGSNAAAVTPATLVIVDLNGRAYDGVAAVATAAENGVMVIAVGQHEDLALRKSALAAGAQRVYSYNKMFTDGPRVIADWLERARTKAGQ